MSQEIQTIKEKITPILKQAGVLRSSIFGSVARGEAKKNSDVDLLVEVKRPFGMVQFGALKRNLEGVLDKPVDVVEYGAVKPAFKENIFKDATLIYEQR